MNNVLVQKLKTPLRGEIQIPPDKSISHRGIMIGALTFGKIKITNFSKGKDCISTLNIFKNLGVEIDFLDDFNIVINSKNGLKSPSVPLDCGNSGTTMRILSGILASRNFNSTLIGDKSLEKRPMKRIIEPLSMMGAKINSNNGFAPLEIFGNNLSCINYKSKIASAQVKSSILLAGLNASGETTVIEPYLSRCHTENMLKYFECDIECGKNSSDFYTKIKKSNLVPKPLYIPGDISSASFFMAAAAIIEGSDIIIKDVGLNKTRTGIIDIMQKMGANIEILDLCTKNEEEVGTLRIKYSDNLKGIEIGGEIIPRLIDEIPIICVLLAHAKGKSVIKDAGDLKNKESDRIKCTADGLIKLGLDVEPTDDGFIINSKEKPKNQDTDIVLDTHFDHRLAMSFFVAGLKSEKKVLIRDFNWVNTSFPEFLPLFSKLGV